MWFRKFYKFKLLSNGMEAEETRWKASRIFWLLFILSLVFLLTVFQLQTFDTFMPVRNQSDNFSALSLKGFLIKTTGCRIPYMDPFDSSIKKFIKSQKTPKCNKGKPALVDSNLTSLILMKTSLSYYNISNLEELNCCFKPFWRRIPKKGEVDNKVIFSKNCTIFSNTTEVNDEFVKVTCNYENKTIYNDFFSFVPIKKTFTRDKKLNVLVMGLDAISRLNFHRQMPHTIDYLQNNLSAIELLGYNKVGDNTFPNLIPVLTGLNEQELEKRCWKKNGRFDDCPFIWKNYSDEGYVTAFGEDSAWMGIFNYLKKGFMSQPTDYFWGIFNYISENNIGNCHDLNVYECVGAREVYKTLLDYVNKFATTMTMADLPFFAFFWMCSLSHDYLNKPKRGDTTYQLLFQYLQESGILDNTALVVMSDHGIRWGEIRQTYQGRMEERLPFVYLVLPSWYKQQNQQAYSNLMRNSRRLTTPFDLHETLMDFLHPRKLTLTSTKSRGYSLFSEITPKRTCDDAGISSHWCTCQQSFSIDKNDKTVVESANFAVNHMNSLLEGYAQCSNLTLAHILDARIMSHGDHILNKDKTRDFMITLQTVPGDGVFEVTIRMTVSKRTTYHFEVMGTISRLNLYGKQSACITDFHLKLYCYCKRLFN